MARKFILTWCPLKEHEARFPNCVICNSESMMEFDYFNDLLKYLQEIHDPDVFVLHSFHVHYQKIGN